MSEAQTAKKRTHKCTMDHNAEKKRLCNDWIILDQSINLYNSFGFFATKDGILPRSLGRRPVEYGQHSTVVLLPGWKKWHGSMASSICWDNDIVLNMTNSPWHPHSSLQYAAGHQAKCLKCSRSLPSLFGFRLSTWFYVMVLRSTRPKLSAKEHGVEKGASSCSDEGSHFAVG